MIKPRACPLILVKEDGGRQELQSWESDTIGEMLQRELTLSRELCAKLEVVFCDVVLGHSDIVDQVGMQPMAEIQINGLSEVIEIQKAEEERKRQGEARKRQAAFNDRLRKAHAEFNT